MKEPARLIIPAWGETYARRVVSITLPAILAPGNLPRLSELFEIELVIVTESGLFDLVRQAPAFRSAHELGTMRLVALDDLLLDDPVDYGAVLTHALFRGFSDLGAAMTETYLIFLNADFIVSDGSLGHLGRLMREGRRIIHAPSFRVALEDVMPQLQARVDAAAGTLRIPSRDMVRLALANKHRTVKARTVNQQHSHQTWPDQYYWYVDEETLIGYQWPVALVAIKPERVVSRPLLVWDYGFIPEAAPNATPYFIADSDDFFMIEPQSSASGNAMIRAGSMSFDAIARNLSTWTTKEQRECGKQLLTLHAGDLPENLDSAVAESRAYMAEIYRRLSPKPVSHIGHPMLGAWFDGATERMRATHTRQRSSGIVAQADVAAQVDGFPHDAQRNVPRTSHVLKAIYRRTFGVPPQVNKFHPLWADSASVAGRIAAWRVGGAQKILWIGSRDTLLNRLLSGRIAPSSFLAGYAGDSVKYDGCICELMLDELSIMETLYGKIRPVMKDGAPIAICVVKEGGALDGAELLLERIVFPAVDISAIHFFGTTTTRLLSRAYVGMAEKLQRHPMVRALASAVFLIALAPVSWCINTLAEDRDSPIFKPTWTSLVIDFTVKRALPNRVQATGAD
jgi:hypothetical protein